MVAASAVSMAAVGSAKADAPDIGTVGSTTVLTALSTGTITITFLFSRAEFTNYLVLFNSTAAGVVTDGAVAGYPNPLITAVGAAPAAGVGVPLTINIDVVAIVLLFGICTTGTVNHRVATPTRAASRRIPWHSTPGPLQQPRRQPARYHHRRGRGIPRPVFLVAWSKFPAASWRLQAPPSWASRTSLPRAR